MKKEKKRISWSKLLLAILFINFFILEVFIGFITLKTFTVAFAIGSMPDFTPLVALTGAVIGETLSYGIYAAKAKAENTEGGINFALAKWENEKEVIE